MMTEIIIWAAELMKDLRKTFEWNVKWYIATAPENPCLSSKQVFWINNTTTPSDLISYKLIEVIPFPL